jgi:hypothetical protein
VCHSGVKRQVSQQGLRWSGWQFKGEVVGLKFELPKQMNFQRHALFSIPAGNGCLLVVCCSGYGFAIFIIAIKMF